MNTYNVLGWVLYKNGTWVKTGFYFDSYLRFQRNSSVACSYFWSQFHDQARATSNLEIEEVFVRSVIPQTKLKGQK